MRVIITGGTGLIGRALTDSLVSDGHEVIILSRSPERATGLPSGARAVRWDARTAEGWGHLADGADVIVNLVGQTIGSWPWTAERKRRIRDSRVHGGQAVVQAVEEAEAKPRVLIQASGISYYGDRGDEMVAEDTAPGDSFLAHVAIEWEDGVSPVESMGVRRASLRSALVLSLEGGAFPLMLLPFRFFVGGTLGSGRQWLPWVHVVDEVRAIRFLIDHERAAGPFNVSAPGVLTHAEFAKVAARVLRRPALMRVPEFVLRPILGEMSMLLLEGQRAVPQRLTELGFEFRFPDMESALRDLVR
jgi:uncharacterized protein (TIGR01777 family)